MRPSTAAVGTLGLASGVAIAAYVFDARDVQYGAEAAAMLALGVCARLAGTHVRPRIRWALVGFCLLLALGSLVKLAGQQVPVPDPGPLLPDGCPADTADGYWRSQLRYQQVYEVLRSAAYASGLYAVLRLPRSPRRPSRAERLVTGLTPATLTLLGLLPLAVLSDDRSALVATAPGVLTLILAVALVITSTRRVNTWDQTSVLLTAGVSLMVLAAALAIETLAEVERQTSAFGPASGVKTICFSVTVVGSQPSAGLASAWPGIVALLLAGPVLFVWSVLATNAPEPPSRKQATTDQRRT